MTTKPLIPQPPEPRPRGILDNPPDSWKGLSQVLVGLLAFMLGFALSLSGVISDRDAEIGRLSAELSAAQLAANAILPNPVSSQTEKEIAHQCVAWWFNNLSLKEAKRRLCEGSLPAPAFKKENLQ